MMKLMEGDETMIDLERQAPQTGQAERSWPRSVRLLLAGGFMAGASLVPWLADPLYGALSPWNSWLSPGWSLPLPGLNLGWCSLLLGLACWVGSLPVWRKLPIKRGGLIGYRLVRWLSVLLLLQFLLSYSASSSPAVAALNEHKREAQLIRRHLGYNLPRDWLPVTAPFSLDDASLRWRTILLVDQLRPGILLFLAGLGLLAASTAGAAHAAREPRRAVPPYSLLLGPAILVLVISSAPLALLCEYQVRLSLAAGDYAAARSWLELASGLRPELTQTAAYHAERGSWPPEPAQSADARLSLARLYLYKRAYLQAYHELSALWQTGPRTPWLREELTTALEGLIEQAWPPGKLLLRSAAQSARVANAAGWLQILLHVDKKNLYAHYMMARAWYELRNYYACIAEMKSVLQLSPDSDIASSAYTYIGQGEIAAGRYSEGRQALLLAVALDPGYHNNTAREALSGLH
jgi:hypothetical protein